MADNQLPNDNIFKNVRTLEDIINVLSILYTNMNTLSRNYYDLFVNPVAMTVPMKLYDENGNLTEKDIPNVASYRTSVMSGNGSPVGNRDGQLGNFYIDLTTGDLYYYFGQTSGNLDWVSIWNSNSEFLVPNGDGSELTNLSADQIVRDILKVQRGGTGVGSITGLIKGNGEAPFSSAVDGTDYLGPSMTGVISYFAGSSDNIPKGWLVCNGQEVSKRDYSNLYNIIGDTYGVPLDLDNFVLPNLIGKYVKGGVVAGTLGEAIVGTHSHSLTGSTGTESSHTHGPGTFKITGYIPAGERVFKSGFTFPTQNNPFTLYKGNVATGDHPNNTFDTDVWKLEASASAGWTGVTGSGSAHSHTLSGSTAVNAQDAENDVAHITMIPIIKY